MVTPATVVRRVLSGVGWTLLLVLAVAAPVVPALAEPTPGRLVAAVWAGVVGDEQASALDDVGEEARARERAEGDRSS